MEKKYETRADLLLSDLENEIDQIVQTARLEIQKIEHEYKFKLSLLLQNNIFIFDLRLQKR